MLSTDMWSWRSAERVRLDGLRLPLRRVPDRASVVLQDGNDLTISRDNRPSGQIGLRRQLPLEPLGRLADRAALIIVFSIEILELEAHTPIAFELVSVS